MDEQNNNLQNQDFEGYNFQNNNFDDQEPEVKQKTPMPKSAVAVMVVSIIVAVLCTITMLITLLARGGGPVIFVDEECYLVVNGTTTEYKVHNYNDDWEIYDEGEGSCEDKVFYRNCYQCDAFEWRNGTYEDHEFYLESDNLYHWDQCQNCDYAENETVHTATDEGVCEICLASIGTDGVIYEVSTDGTYAMVTGYNGSETRVMISGKYNGVPVTVIDDSAFAGNRSITAVVIPNGVTSINKHAFYYCANLSSIVIPNSVISIGNEAFYGCNASLYSEYYNGRYVCSGNNPYAVLVELTDKNLTSYEINENTKIISNGVFRNCTKVTEIVIPNGVTAISDNAFYNCTRLSSVTIADSVKFIGENAFQGCINLINVKLPAGISSISKYTFYNCTRLTSVIIPKSVTHIGDYAFNGCADLTDVYYRGSEAKWQEITRAQGNTKLANVTVHYNYAD